MSPPSIPARNLAMKMPLLTALALAFPAVVATAPVELVYAPAAGTEITRRFASTFDLELDELQVVMDGEEIPSEYLPDLQIEIHAEIVLEVVDRLVKVGDGRPNLLHRTFAEVRDETKTTVSMPPAIDGSETRTGECPLVGRTLVYEWNDDAGEYDVDFDEEGGDVELLVGLDEDLDLRALLPEDEVESGDEWKVDPSFLHQLERPGGLPMAYQGAEDDDPFGPEIAWEGDAKVVFEGWDEEADGRVALLRLQGEAFRETTREGSLEEVPGVDGTATEEIETLYDFEGVLRWDVEEGMMLDFEFSCDLSQLSVTIRDEGQEGPDYEHSMPMTGTWTVAIEIDRE